VPKRDVRTVSTSLCVTPTMLDLPNGARSRGAVGVAGGKDAMLLLNIDARRSLWPEIDSPLGSGGRNFSCGV